MLLSLSEICSIASDSLWPHGLYSPWNSSGQNTGVGSLSLLQWIFPTQELNQGLLHCWGRQWHPTPALLPGKSHGLRSLVGRSPRVGHDWATSLSLFTSMHWRRKWQPTPVFLPGESQGRGSLVGCRLWGHRVGHDWSDLAAAAATPPLQSDSLPAELPGKPPFLKVSFFFV